MFETKSYIIKLLSENKIPNFPPFIMVTQIDSLSKTSDKIYNSTIKDIEDGEIEECFVLESNVIVKSKYYRIQIITKILEEDDLFFSILISLIILFLLIIISIFTVQYFSSKNLLTPFNDNIKKLGDFSLVDLKTPKFQDSKIDEFNTLNKSLERLIQRIIDDYNNLREFTENASHELQTPLSIIQNKIELLIQETDLNSKQIIQIRSINNSVSRLIKLNRSLILLTNIEGKNYRNISKVEINLITKNLIDFYDEIIKIKKVDLKLEEDNKLIVNMNYELAEILISNLFLNAINHNVNEGRLIIKINENEILFSNTATKEVKDSKIIFNRFFKENSNKNSFGLGLAIVKKICEKYDLKIDYFYINKMHNFKLKK
jgi:signal transduction histidine kinase